MSRFAATWICFAITIGCGPEPAPDLSTSSTGPTDDSTADPSAASSEGGPSCDSYLTTDELLGPRVEVIVRNASADVVFLDASPGCFFTPEVAVRGPDGETLLPGGDPAATCAAIVGNATCEIGGNDCGSAQAGRLAPGASDETGWLGTFATVLDLDPACAPEPSCPSMCTRIYSAAPAAYEIVINGYRECTGACECEIGEGPDVCGLYGVAELGSPTEYVAVIDYPTQTSVEITIVDD